MANSRDRARKQPLRGTHLWRDPRTGIYVFRRLDERTGRRFRRSTGTKILRIAMAKAEEFETEYQRELAGLSTFEGYRRPLGSFLDPFLESLSGGPKHRRQLANALRRTFRLLGLDVLADIEDFTKVERKLLTLDGKHGFNRTTLARCFQAPLKQFSRYLAGRREIPVDHLAAWPVLKRDPPKRRRRALHPDEVARILAASDCLDAMRSSVHSMRPMWTALLVAAPRVSALTSLDVKDLDREHGRLIMTGNDIKRVGAGSLDDRTSAELVDYIGERTEGPLFLSPEGLRVDGRNSVRRWQLAASLAFVDLDWPEGEERDLQLVYLVQHALRTGRVLAGMGGPLTGPNAPGPKKLAARQRTALRVRAIADGIRPTWEQRMRGVDQHCLRMTHRTWALAAGVPEILIDRQLGHSSPAGDAALRAAWSAVGRSRYTDLGFLTADARRSAQAVRDVLDRAVKEFREAVQGGKTALLRSTQGATRRTAGTGTHGDSRSVRMVSHR